MPVHHSGKKSKQAEGAWGRWQPLQLHNKSSEISIIFHRGKTLSLEQIFGSYCCKLLCHTYTPSAAARALEESQKHLKSHQVPPLSVLQVISKNHKSRLVRNRHNSIRSGCGPELHLKTCVRFDLLKKGFELLF